MEIDLPDPGPRAQAPAPRPEILPYPEGRRPLLPPRKDPAFARAIRAAFSDRRAVAAAICHHSLLGGECCMASVLANGRIFGGVSGCTPRIAAASLIPRGSAPVILWDPGACGLSRAIPKGRMIIPIRTLYEDFRGYCSLCG